MVENRDRPNFVFGAETGIFSGFVFVSETACCNDGRLPFNTTVTLRVIANDIDRRYKIITFLFESSAIYAMLVYGTGIFVRRDV